MSGSWHGGKGSSPRPVQDRKQFEENWDKIFGKKNSNTETKEKPKDSSND
jgi:hypothetical protein